MAEFVEWHEGAGGDYGDPDRTADLFGDVNTGLQRDAALFLIDCRSSMFKQALIQQEQQDDAENAAERVAARRAARREARKQAKRQLRQRQRQQQQQLFVNDDDPFALPGTNNSFQPTATTTNNDDDAEDNDDEGENDDDDDDHSEGGPTLIRKRSPFQCAIQVARHFYQDKIVESDKDYVGVLLYNTREALNATGFAHIYAFHPLDPPSASRMRELEILARAGIEGSRTREDFEDLIGFGDLAVQAEAAKHEREQSMTLMGGGLNNHRRGTGAQGRLLFSEALWAAQHAHNMVSSKKITSRRLFIFTDDDNPVGDSGIEREKCMCRMRDLQAAGITVQLYAHAKVTSEQQQQMPGQHQHRPGGGAVGPDGGEIPSSSTINSTSTNTNNNNAKTTFATGGTTSTGTTTGTVHTTLNNLPGAFISSSVGGGSSGDFFSLNQQPFQTVVAGGNNATTNTVTTASTNHNNNGNVRVSASHSINNNNGSSGGFDPSKFWEELLKQCYNQNNADNAAVAGAFLLGQQQRDRNSLATSFNNDNTDPNHNPRNHIKIDHWTTNFEGLISDVRRKVFPQRSQAALRFRVGGSDGSAAPHCVVGVYTPVMTCSKPKTTQLEASTNHVTVTERKVVSSVTMMPVEVERRIHTVEVAKQSVPFSADEVKTIKQLVTPDGPGITILCFKPRQWLDEHQVDWNCGTTFFIHPHKTYCDVPGARFFGCLWKVMKARDVVAVAESVPRKDAPPRLCVIYPANERRPGVPSLFDDDDDDADNNNNDDGGNDGAENIMNNRNNSGGSSKSNYNNGLNPPVIGSGFFVKPLPYAEDFRSLKLPKMPTGTADLPIADDATEEELDARAKMIEEEEKRRKDDVARVSKIIRRAVVDQLAEVANPSLQRKYYHLERLALSDNALEDNTGAAVAGGNDSAAELEMLMAGNREPTDGTVPDVVGLEKIAGKHVRALREAFGMQHYQPAAFLPKERAKPAAGGAGIVAKKEEDIKDIDFAALHEAGTLSKLTIPKLKKFLETKHMSVTGKKDELLKRIGAYLNRQREAGQVRQREE